MPSALKRGRGIAGHDRVLVLLFLALHILPFASRPALIGGDEVHYALMASSMGVDGDLSLDEDYGRVAAGSLAAGRKQAGNDLDRHLIEIGGRKVFAHPLGLPAIAAPWIHLQDRFFPGAAPDLLLASMSLGLTLLALVAAYRTLGRVSGALPGVSGATVLLIYFSTPLWFYSRTFFTEPFLWSCVVLAACALATGRWRTASLLLGSLFLLKEGAVLLILPMLAFTMHRFGFRRAVGLSIGPLVAFALFCAKNVYVYGTPLTTFQPFRAGSLPNGLVGLAIDPSHGVLWFAPILLVASLGWHRRFERRDLERNSDLALAQRYALVAVIAWVTMTALWVDWGGGSSYGPRLLVPIMPLFGLPLLSLLRSATPGIRRLISCVAALSFLVGFCAAIDPFHALWSAPVLAIVVGNPLGLLLGLITLGFVSRRLRARIQARTGTVPVGL